MEIETEVSAVRPASFNAEPVTAMRALPMLAEVAGVVAMENETTTLACSRCRMVPPRWATGRPLGALTAVMVTDDVDTFTAAATAVLNWAACAGPNVAGEYPTRVAVDDTNTADS